MIPTRRQINEAETLRDLLEAHPYCNCVSSGDTRVHSYNNVLEMLNGCVESGDFLNAVTVDVTKDPINFTETCRVLNLRRNHSFVRAIEARADEFIEENGTYGAYDTARKSAQNCRGRIKTFTKHTIAQLDANMTTHFGRNVRFVNAILDGDGSSYGALRLNKAAMIFDLEHLREYPMFSEMPPVGVRKWLREHDYRRASTNLLWYRDLTSGETMESCSARAREFATMLLNDKLTRIANDQQDVRQMRRYIASL